MPEGGQNLLSRDLGTNMSVAATLPKQDEASLPNRVTEQLMGDHTRQVLALAVTLGFFGLLFLLCFKAAPNANLAMFNIVLGSLGTAWVGVMAYYFGGTHAGRAKDWMLYQSQPAQSPK
jgi:uncharacterized BrkB/YihY/UPF0761 family membrane protein